MSETTQLMELLRVEDEAIVQLGQELETAKINFEVGGVRYAAVRDMVWERLGNPYRMAGADTFLPSKGRYRYLGMPVGDAIMYVIFEEGQPISLPEIGTRLFDGGMRGAEGGFIDGRAANAAVMTLVRTGQVKKIEMAGDELTHYELMPAAPEWEEVEPDPEPE